MASLWQQLRAFWGVALRHARVLEASMNGVRHHKERRCAF